MRLLHVVGARPNFMKAAPVIRAFQQRPRLRQTLVHTGQHYDANMSDIFFDELAMPRPDICLNVGSGSHAVQTAEVMRRFETYVLDEKPDWVLVYGDVNSTLAATLVCAKMQVRVAHVEAGLRSFDRGMPEEINRIVTDQLANLLLTPSPDADANLRREGVAQSRIRRVGNVMIDTLVHLLPKARSLDIPDLPQQFGLVTLHRPSNVDDPEKLRDILRSLERISHACPLLFPIHPRTRHRMQALGIVVSPDARVALREPVGYLECLALQSRARFVITDSGGLQEETSYLGVRCFTLRENTERPITVEEGTNLLIGSDLQLLEREVTRVLREESLPPRQIDLWDGKASERIVAAVLGESSQEPSDRELLATSSAC